MWTLLSLVLLALSMAAAGHGVQEGGQQSKFTTSISKSERCTFDLDEQPTGMVGLSNGFRGFACLAVNSTCTEPGVQYMWDKRCIKPSGKRFEPKAMPACDPMHAVFSRDFFVNLEFEQTTRGPDCSCSTDKFSGYTAADVKHERWESHDNFFQCNSGIFDSKKFHVWHGGGCVVHKLHDHVHGDSGKFYRVENFHSTSGNINSKDFFQCGSGNINSLSLVGTDTNFPFQASGLVSRRFLAETGSAGVWTCNALGYKSLHETQGCKFCSQNFWPMDIEEHMELIYIDYNWPGTTASEDKFNNVVAVIGVTTACKISGL